MKVKAEQLQPSWGEIHKPHGAYWSPGSRHQQCSFFCSADEQAMNLWPFAASGFRGHEWCWVSNFSITIPFYVRPQYNNIFSFVSTGLLKLRLCSLFAQWNSEMFIFPDCLIFLDVQILFFLSSYAAFCFCFSVYRIIHFVDLYMSGFTSTILKLWWKFILYWMKRCFHLYAVDGALSSNFLNFDYCFGEVCVINYSSPHSLSISLSLSPCLSCVNILPPE